MPSRLLAACCRVLVMNGGYGRERVRVTSIDSTVNRAAGSGRPVIRTTFLPRPLPSATASRSTLTSSRPAASAACLAVTARSTVESLSASIRSGVPPTSTRSHDSARRSASHAIRSRTSGARPRSSRFAISAAHCACKATAELESKVMLAEMSQDSAGVNSRISCSRSTTIRVATLCTRPALKPPATFFQRIGDT